MYSVSMVSADEGWAVRRGEGAKLVRRAANMVIYTPTRPTFADVPSDYFAYGDVETLYQHGILSGAACATDPTTWLVAVS